MEPQTAAAEDSGQDEEEDGAPRSFSFLGGKGEGLKLCLVSDVGEAIMRGQGEQVLPHYCNEQDIPPLHQLKKVAIKVPNKVPRGKKKKKTTL